MRKAALSGLVAFTLIIGMALILKATPAASEDFCFGYSICDSSANH
jgi:hypothetical protein